MESDKDETVYGGERLITLRLSFIYAIATKPNPDYKKISLYVQSAY